MSASAGAVAAGEAGPRPRVAVLNAVNLPANLAEQRAKLSDALATSVSQRGYELVATSRVCADTECLKSLASGSGATDILVVAGGTNDLMGYRIELRLWNAAADREDHSSAECNTCSAAQMIESVVRAAGPLLDRIPALAIGAPHVTPPAAAPAIAVTPPARSPHVNTERSPARWALGLSLIVGGAAAMGAGVWHLTSNEDLSGCREQICNHAYHTSTSGLLLTAGGAAAAAGGVAALFVFRDHSSTSVAIGPAGLSIAGTY